MWYLENGELMWCLMNWELMCYRINCDAGKHFALSDVPIMTRNQQKLLFFLREPSLSACLCSMNYRTVFDSISSCPELSGCEQSIGPRGNCHFPRKKDRDCIL